MTRYFFLKDLNVKQIKTEFNEVYYRESSPSYATFENWVAEFKCGRTSIEDVTPKSNADGNKL